LALLRRAQELGPDSGQVDYYLGRTYLALGQTAEAESTFGRALAVTSDDKVRAQIEDYLATIH
jgi:Flp pilus assembly protein TadD